MTDKQIPKAAHLKVVEQKESGLIIQLLSCNEIVATLTVNRI